MGIRGSDRPASGTRRRARRSWRGPGGAWWIPGAGRSATTSARPFSTATSSPWAIRRCPGATGSTPAGRDKELPMSSAGHGDIRRLIDIMARLRDPDHGCPWELEQDFASIAPYTVEEAYEEI